MAEIVSCSVEPLGDIALYDKLTFNTIFALGTLVLLALAARIAQGREDGS
jgi:hypothetical protein